MQYNSLFITSHILAEISKGIWEQCQSAPTIIKVEIPLEVLYLATQISAVSLSLKHMKTVSVTLRFSTALRTNVLNSLEETAGVYVYDKL